MVAFPRGSLWQLSKSESFTQLKYRIKTSQADLDGDFNAKFTQNCRRQNKVFR